MRKTESTPRTADGQARVQVRGRYDPDIVVTRAGRPLRITFTRHDTWPCSDRVVFPELGVSAELPPHEDVIVDLLPEFPGEYEFTCGMGMLRGRLIVLG
jgi:plastocyanin domain-containing protein